MIALVVLPVHADRSALWCRAVSPAELRSSTTVFAKLLVMHVT
ncbi:hypothetical protein HDC93_003452 [Streptomyces sp. AK010]|nr:hypothetical protein [Streptomyces sp. AK010]